MEHADFVVWMLCYPLVSATSSYMAWLRGQRYTDTVIGIAAWVSMVTWLGIGGLLY